MGEVMSKRKTIILSSLGVLLLISLVIGISYAYWLFRTNQTSVNTIGTSCLNVTLTDVTSAIKLEDAYPISDEDGMSTTPYTFTITNTCDSFISYEVLLGVTEDTTMNSAYLDAVLDYNQIQTLDTYPDFDSTLEGYKEVKVLQKGSLSGEDEATYNLRLWMDKDVTSLDSMNKVFEGKIIISAVLSTYSPIDQGFKTLAEAMLVNEYQSTSLEDAKAKIEAKQKPDFAHTAPIIDWTENHASTTTEITSMMPHPDLVGNGEDYTVNLTSDNILPLIGTGYTFNTETGRYTLTGYTNVDPTMLNYNNSDGTKYYFCEASFSTNYPGIITTSSKYTDCEGIYQLINATKIESSTSSSNGSDIKTMNYQMTGYLYKQVEQESDKSDRGLYMMEDEYGKSYYYRGSVTNNYVKFAGYYWRIIRQNGDGSVRLLYAGTTPNAKGDDLQIKKSYFNRLRANPGYTGYMYGNTFYISYEQTHANEQSSAIKTELDNWYQTNIVDKNLSSYIADPGFCNDRELVSGNGVKDSVDTYFKGHERYVNHTPSLVCSQQNDLFTVENEKGNQALTNPIGLITVDELMLGGLSDGYLNRLSYTYSSSHYWTMTPSYYEAAYSVARGIGVHTEGYAYFFWISSPYGIRPVINLASNVEISGGIGTKNAPFVIKTV